MLKKNELTAYAAQMPALAKTLSGVFLDSLERPVIDKTGLTGTYDFHLKWASDLDQEASPKAADDGTKSQRENLPGISIFSAIQDQLGLRIIAVKDSFEVIVIDSAHMPTEN